MRRPAEPPRRRPRPLTWGGTAAGVTMIQALLLAALSWPSAAPLSPPPEDVLIVELTAPPPVPSPPRPAATEDAPSPPGPAESAPEEPPRASRPAPAPPVPAAAPRAPLRPPPPDTPVLAIQAVEPGPPDLPLVAGARLAGALAAGGGHGAGAGAGAGAGNGGDGVGAGGDCDMRARLESALRGDVRIRQATAAVLAARDAGGQAVLVWDGDWLQSPGEAGKGLAGVRQAIAVEVGFAPRACRDQAVRGLVAIPLDADPAGPKLALGTGAWRWRDLLDL